MAFEKLALFAIVEFEYEAPAGALGHFYTDQPGNAMAERTTGLVMPVATGRRTVKLRLPGTVKGKLFRVKVTSAGRVILYGGRVYARPLGIAGAQWDWHPLPIEPTANEFTTLKLPIEGTAEKYTEFKLPIEPTAETFKPFEIPMHKTPELLSWVDVPVAR